MRRCLLGVVVTLALLGGSACLRRRESPDPLGVPPAVEVANRQLSTDEAKAMLGEVGENWLYGQGLGETAVTVGTIIVFPPYGLWVLGNAALSATGYEPLRFSDLLPEDGGDVWRNTYDSITSAPGQVSAAIAGREFRTPEVAAVKLKKYIEPAPKQRETGSDPAGRAGR